jgi:sulfite reductase (ferredoxin)
VALAEDLTALRRLAVACPALPTCGQALTEAERVLPDVVEGLDKALVQAGLGGAPVRLNMTGCPNGCARPYTAEVGIVGRTKTTYDVYLGGAVGGDRLAVRLRDGVKLSEVPALLQPVFERYAADGAEGEGFGDFVHRIGADEVTTWLPLPTVGRRVATARERGA